MAAVTAGPADVCIQTTAPATTAVRRHDTLRASSFASLAALTAAVERAGPVAARCRALSRLARSPELDDESVDRIAGYSARNHQLELRTCAASALGEAGPSSAVGYLLELAEDGSPVMADAAVRALAQREDEASRAAVLSLARSGPRAVRATAAIALAEAGLPEATSLLVELLAEAAPQEQEGLVIALGTTRDPRALSVLQDLLANGSRTLSHAAVTALGELGSVTATNILLQLWREQPGYAYSVANALAHTGADVARKALIDAAEGLGNAAATSAALQALNGLDGPDVRAAMERALESGAPARVQAAIEYFATHPDEQSISNLSALVQGGSPMLSFPALHALARVGGDGARSVVAALARGEGRMKEVALSVLATMPDGAEEARQLAIEQLRRGRSQGGQALELLARDSSPEAQAALIAAAQRNDSTSSHAIMLLGQRRDAESRRVLEEIASATGPSERRSRALHALALSGDPRAVKTLRGALQSSDPSVRTAAVSALAQLGGPEAEQVALAASRDASQEVASSAVGVLAQVGTPAALDRLEEIAASADGQVAGQALASLSSTAPDRAASLATRLVTANDPALRQSAVGVASALPEAVGSRILASALADGDPGVVSHTLDHVDAAMLDAASLRPALVELTNNPRMPDAVRERARQLLAGENAPSYFRGHAEMMNRPIGGY